MKRFSTLILISFLLFVSCDDGTKYVEDQLKQYNYSELMQFIKTNEGEWSKESGVKLALSGLSKDYYSDAEVRQFFETEIYEGDSELIQEYGIRAIISNCDDTSIEKILKHVAQSSNKDNLTTNNHLQETILGYDGEICNDVEQMVSEFKEDFVKTNASIDSLEKELSLLSPSIFKTKSDVNFLNDRVDELDKHRPTKRCFVVLKNQGSNTYEALLLREWLTGMISDYYPRNKGSIQFKANDVENKHVLLISTSGEIESKGLVCLDVSDAGTTPITTKDGFNAKWNVYREEDIEIFNARRKDLLSQAGMLDTKSKSERGKVNQLNSLIDSYKKIIDNYSGDSNSKLIKKESSFSKLDENEKSDLINFVSNIGDPPVYEDEIAVIETDYGRIVFTFDLDHAPLHASNFKKLAYAKYYDGTTFHRVISGFMIQGGDINSRDADPLNDGMGGPGYTIEAEIHNAHKRGAIAAARLGNNSNPERRSNGSQFYICHVDVPHLDGEYTVFGQIIEGIDVVDKIAEVNTGPGARPLEDVVMNKVYTTRMSEL